MLFNIQRSMFANGNNLQLSVDTSYRYTFQNWGLIILATVDRTGTVHRVAYAMTSSEDTVSIEFMLTAVKINFERLVKWLHDRNITEF
jgi:hypothetical protein